MTISIDSNLIAAVWNPEDALNPVAVRVLGELISNQALVICGAVYGELMAGPLRDEESLDFFLRDTGIAVDWLMGEDIWREAGRAYRGYAQRRRSSGGNPPRRILADFLIGAHALVRGYSLLSIDAGHFAAAFPGLQIIEF
jgi:hypothetical protein